MFPRWWRLGIRPQLTIIVILGAILSTAATLFIADNAIQNYVLQQAQTQEIDNMKIANLVLQTRYGQNISIATDNQMVVDEPASSTGAAFNKDNNFGRYPLNGADGSDYVDYVSQLIDNSVSVYQCADARGEFQTCTRIATTFSKGAAQNGTAQRELNVPLSSGIASDMGLGTSPHEWQGVDTIDGRQYYTDYSPIFNPQRQFIGVLSVAVPLAVVTSVVTRTTIELILIGSIIMIAGIVLSLFFASTIVGTLQRAARQVSGASERIGAIASQQASGSAQQVWAINAINQALQNFSETAQDIAQRTDQLAQISNQVRQRRGSISPTQLDSILAYITRSVHDVSVASRQQAAQYERMTGAMQAVIEIAEQVAGSSQQSTESSDRLELVVRQLRQLVGVRRLGRPTSSEALSAASMPNMMDAPTAGANKPQGARRTVRAVRPARRAEAEQQNDLMNGGGMGQMAAMPAGVMSGARDGMNGMDMNAGMGATYGANAGRIGMQQQAPQTGQRALGNTGGFTGNPETYDWRLPPMPEMPPLPNLNLGGAYPSAQDAQEQGHGYGGAMSNPNAGGRSNALPDWPMSLRDSRDPTGRNS